MTTWDEIGIGEEPYPPHLGVADDLEQDLEEVFARFRFEKNSDATRIALVDAAVDVIARYVAEDRIPETIADVAKRVRVRQDPLNPSAITLELHDTLRYWLTTGRVPRSRLMGGRVAVPAQEPEVDPQVVRMAAVTMLTALESVTRFGPVTLERRGNGFAVVYSNGADGDEKLEIGGYADDLPTAVARYFSALLEHTNTA